MYQEDNANLNDEFMLNEYARYINLCLYDKLWETLLKMIQKERIFNLRLIIHKRIIN